MTAQNYQLLIWDGSKQKRIDSETTELKLGKLSLGVFTDIEAALSQEIAERQAAIASEQADRAAADSSLSSSINTVAANLAQEITDRASGDASTLASAQAYADQKIVDLVNAAPGTLDTLKEIADAIANDANIAATLTASIASTQAEVDAVEVALASETSARESADSALDARVEDIETDLNTQVVALFENNAAAYADALPGKQDPSDRDGWYFKNLAQGNKINWYFFDGTAENVSLGDFSGYAVVTFDSLVSKPHLAVYTTATGSGDAAAWYKSRVVYLAQGSPVAGVKYLMYFGQDPLVHPELPRLTMAADSVITQGTQDASERVFTAVIGSDSATSANNCAFVAESVGVFSPSVKRKVKLRIQNSTKADMVAEIAARAAADTALQGEIDAEEARAIAAEASLQSQINSISSSSIAALEADVSQLQTDLASETSARESADTALQGDINTVSAGLAQELLDRASAVSAVQSSLASETSRAEGVEAGLQSDIDAVEAGLAQELLDRASADSGLQSSINTVSANLAQELLDRASADASIQSDVDALEAVVGDLKKLSLSASELIPSGKICYIKADGTVALAVASVDLSDAQLLISSENVASGASGKFFVVEGSVVGGFSGLTPGKKYFVSSTVAGSVVDNTAGFSSGNSVYTVGRAISASEISFAPVFEFEY